MQPSSLRWPPPVGQLRTTTWQNSKIFQLIGFKRMRDPRGENVFVKVHILRWLLCFYPGGKQLGSPSPWPEISTTSIAIGADFFDDSRYSDIHKLSFRNFIIWDDIRISSFPRKNSQDSPSHRYLATKLPAAKGTSWAPPQGLCTQRCAS